MGEIMRAILYAVWALFIVAAVLALVFSARKTKRQAQQMADWPKAPATVTGSVAGWTNGGGGSSRSRRYFAAYQFTDPHGNVRAGTSEISLAAPPVPGALLDVAFNPADPGQSLQVSAAPRSAMGCLIAFFAVFGVASFLVVSYFPLP